MIDNIAQRSSGAKVARYSLLFENGLITLRDYAAANEDDASCAFVT